MYSHAHLWFTGLLLLLILGFWPSYFSPSASSATFAHHFHSVVMLIWILMLIAQPWLIRTKKRSLHRAIGRSSLVIAPLVVVSALNVVHEQLGAPVPPYPPILLSFFWLGAASALLYGLLYTLAILNRRDMQIHARYMAATSLVFITPGAGRLLGRIGEETGISMFNFQLGLWAPVLVGIIMLMVEFKKDGRIRTPWALATALILIIVLGFYFLPQFSWLGSFAEWYGESL